MPEGLGAGAAYSVTHILLYSLTTSLESCTQTPLHCSKLPKLLPPCQCDAFRDRSRSEMWNIASVWTQENNAITVQLEGTLDASLWHENIQLNP